MNTEEMCSIYFILLLWLGFEVVGERERERERERECISIISVSYTHLDVYKRQRGHNKKKSF